MEAQPHLLLLQKTMMTAEGVGRGLNPSINMWQLSEPLIRDWAQRNLSQPAQMRHFAREAAETLRDTPRVLREVREFLEKVQTSGVPLAPHALATLEEKRETQHRAWMRLGWTIAALLAAMFATILQGYN